MPNDYVFEGVEIDIPRCGLTWGVGDCTAALSSKYPHKCWNLLRHCGAPDAYDPSETMTLRFCRPGPMPAGEVWYPVLDNVRRSSQTVNVAGSDPDMSGFGRQASMSFDLSDFAWHEQDVDPYWADRISGAAQLDTIGYRPVDVGLFLTKLKARWPYYGDAPARHVSGVLRNGVLSPSRTLHFFLKDWKGPKQGKHTLECRGVLDFASKTKSLAPAPSPGRLTLDLTADATTFEVTPAGSGSNYAASGWVCIGGEVMAFTRSAETFTVTRGQRGTAPSTHAQGDTVQQVLAFRGARLDDVVHTLVEGFTETPATYLRSEVKDGNEAEVTRWGASVLVETDICQPTEVSKLLGELAYLGCSIREDAEDQAIHIKMNRPLDNELAPIITDDILREIEVEDEDDKRLTQVLFCYKRRDPTKGLEDEGNYAVSLLTVDPEAVARFGGVKTRTIHCRWLDHGDATTASIAMLRYLDRFRLSPKKITIRLDHDDLAGQSLTDVIDLRSTDLSGGDGKTVPQYVQVVSLAEPVIWHDIEAICQAFPFGDRRYGFIAPDTVTNTYDTATDEEKRLYAFIAPDADGFDGGDPPYLVI